MKKTALISLALATSLLNSVTVPALAKPMMSYNPSVPQGVTIAQSTAIVVGFPQNLEINAKQKESQSLTLPLAQPITDSYGKELVPAGSPVAVKIVPEDKKGVYIVAESIVVNGQLVPIKASSSKIASVKIKVKSGKQQANENRAVFANLGGNIATAATNSENELATETMKDATTGAAIGGAFGIVTGLLSSESVYLVRIPQGSVYVLKLDAPVVLPSMGIAAANNPYPHNGNTSPYPQSNSPVNRSSPNSVMAVNNSKLQSQSNPYAVNHHQPYQHPTQNSNVPQHIALTNSAIHRISGQPISPATMARLRSFLAGNNLAEASCGATSQQVTIRINNEFIVCGHPNSKYTPGNYSTHLNGLY